MDTPTTLQRLWLILCGFLWLRRFHDNVGRNTFPMGVAHTAEKVLAEILPETQQMIVALGLPVMHRGGLFNMACLVANGSVLGLVGKQNLAGEGLHYEPRWFKPWPKGVRVDKEIA